jgi:hypothetical protein
MTSSVAVALLSTPKQCEGGRATYARLRLIASLTLRAAKRLQKNDDTN